MKFHFGNSQAIASIVDSLHLYPAKEFKSPTRSTIPLLSLLIHAPEKFAEIVGSLGMPACPDVFLEYTVPPRRGRGKSSHTDVMLRSGEDVLAIEAKWTEPLDDTVSIWRNKGTKPANRDLVLLGWLELLNSRCGSSLNLDHFQDVPYQMIHRAASAAAGSAAVGVDRGMVYLLFTHPNPKVRQATTAAQVRQKLGEFWDRLGQPDQFPFFAIEVKIQATPAYESHLRLKKGDPATSEAVIDALCRSARLFEFETQSPQRITGSIHP